MALFAEVPVQHYRTRDFTGYRGIYRDPPEIDSRTKTLQQKSNIWEQTIAKENLANRKSKENHEAHLAKLRPDLSYKLHTYTRPEWMRRSLPTNIPDHPVSINVNTIRAETHEIVWPGYVDGGKTYDPKTLNGNWVEDRRDVHYEGSLKPKAGNKPEGRETTYSAMCAESGQGFDPDASIGQEPVMELPPVMGPEGSNAFRSKTNYINYQKVPSEYEVADTHPYAPMLRPRHHVRRYETTTMSAYLPPSQRKPAFHGPDHEISKYADELDKYRARWTVSTDRTRERMSSTEYARTMRPHSEEQGVMNHFRASHIGVWH